MKEETFIARVQIPSQFHYEPAVSDLIKKLRNEHSYENGGLLRFKKTGNKLKIVLPLEEEKTVSMSVFHKIFEYPTKPRSKELVKFKGASGFSRLENGETVVFMGEIKQAPGHCIVAKSDGTMSWMHHTDDFELIPNEEA